MKNMSKEKTGKLLAQALAFVPKQKNDLKISDEEKELVSAYINGDIIMRQVAHAMNTNDITKQKFPAARIMNVLKAMVADGRLTIK